MSQHTIELGDLLASIPGFWAAWQDFKRNQKEGENSSFGNFVGQHLPNFLGIGKVDEAIYASLWMKLVAAEKQNLRKLYSNMERYEVDCLRMVISSMSRPIDKITRTAPVPGKGNSPGQPAKEEMTYGEDPRLIFLKALADEVATASDVKDVVAELRANRFIIKDPATHQLYHLWLKTTKWIKKNLLELFDVEKLEDITLDMAARHINLLARQVPYRRPADVNLGFWRGNFRHHPVGTVGLALILTGALVWFIYLANISHN